MHRNETAIVVAMTKVRNSISDLISVRMDDSTFSLSLIISPFSLIDLIELLCLRIFKYPRISLFFPLCSCPVRSFLSSFFHRHSHPIHFLPHIADFHPGLTKYGFSEDAFTSPKFDVDAFVAECRLRLPLDQLQANLGWLTHTHTHTHTHTLSLSLSLSLSLYLSIYLSISTLLCAVAGKHLTVLHSGISQRASKLHGGSHQQRLCRVRQSFLPAGICLLPSYYSHPLPPHSLAHLLSLPHFSGGVGQSHRENIRSTLQAQGGGWG